MRIRLLIALLVSAVCLHAAEPADAGHPLRGEVTRVLAEKKLVLIKHHEIPGFMRAMTMAFSVEDSVWPQLTPGTHLTGTLHRVASGWHLSDVQLTDANFQPLAVAPSEPGYPVEITPLTTTAVPGAVGPTLTAGADGQIYLSWMEPLSDDETALNYAVLDPVTRTWGPAQRIAQGRDWLVSGTNGPQFAVERNGRMTAAWFVNHPADKSAPAPAAGHSAHAAHSSNYQAWFSQYDGTSWSPAVPLSSESKFTEFIALQALARGGVLAVWLDGRAKHTGGDTQQLYGRIVGSDGPDLLIDDSVCDCCHTTLTAFPNGTALVAYRARREGEIRDIYTALFRNGRWNPPHLLNADNWHIDGCPVNGPQLDSIGGHVGAAWFTGANDVPKVYASTSPDAGARFLMPQSIDLGHPLGRVDTLVLQDGSQLVTWIETTGGQAESGLYLRRVDAKGDTSSPVLLAALPQPRAAGFPRIVLLKDYDASPAQILVTFTGDTAGNPVATLLVTLPDLSTLAGRKPCPPCDEQDANATRGHPVKGRITQVLAERGQVVVKHEEIPGVMRGMTMAFNVDPELLPKLAVDQELLGRIERRDREWWLFNVTLLGAPLR